MSDIINASLDLSKLYKTLVDADERKPFLYTTHSSPCPQSKLKVSQKNYTGLLEYGNTIKMDIPRTGLNVVSYLKVNLSGAGAIQFGFGGIIYLFERIDLLQGETVIQTLLPDGILARILSLPESERNGMLSVAGSNASSPFGNLYVPLYLSAYEALENALDTKELQQFTLSLSLCNSIYDIAWTSSVDSSISTGAYLTSSNVNNCIGIMDDGTIASVPYGDVHGQLIFDVAPPVNINNVTYTPVTLASGINAKFITPFGASTNSVQWLLSPSAQLFYNNNGAVGVGMIASSIAGDPVTFSQYSNNATGVMFHPSVKSLYEGELRIGQIIGIKTPIESGGTFIQMTPAFTETATGTSNILSVVMSDPSYLFKVSYLSPLQDIFGKMGYTVILTSVVYPTKNFGMEEISGGAAFNAYNVVVPIVPSVGITLVLYPVHNKGTWLFGNQEFIWNNNGIMMGLLGVLDGWLQEAYGDGWAPEFQLFESGDTLQSIDTYNPTSISLESIFVVPQQPDYFELQKKQFKLPKPLTTLWTSSEREIVTSDYKIAVNANFSTDTLFHILYNGQYLQAYNENGALTLIAPTGDWQQYGLFNLSYSQPSTILKDNTWATSFFVPYPRGTLPSSYWYITVVSTVLSSLNYGNSPPLDSDAIRFTLVPKQGGVVMIQDTGGLSKGIFYPTGNPNSPFSTVRPNSSTPPAIFDIQPLDESNTITFDVPINCKKLVHSTIVMVKQLVDKRTNKTVLASGTSLSGNYLEIASIEISGSSQTLIKYDATELQIMQNRDYNRFHSRYNSTNTFDNMYTIQYGLYDSITQNSGALNFNDLDDARMKVIVNGVPYGEYELIVLHNYWKFMETDGSDGKMTSSYDY